ncbi:MAG: hypothetical protein HC847_15995 [Hydrococcus sp. RU_2_2]|jgi:hypothetical protein|nr:hypothetical protein [Hydrococcus sp. RU_2_2]
MLKQFTKLVSRFRDVPLDYKPVKFVLNSPNEFENIAGIEYQITKFREIAEYGCFKYEQEAVVICKDTKTKDNRGLTIYLTEMGQPFVYIHIRNAFPVRGIFDRPTTVTIV